MSVPAKPQLLFFFSATNGRSRRAEGFIAQALQRRRNHNTFVVRKIDVADHPDVAQRFRVEETPTVLVIDGKRVAARCVQPSGSREMEALLRPWLR
jgi:thioredoxin-like negative regulator of GroEL